MHRFYLFPNRLFCCSALLGAVLLLPVTLRAQTAPVVTQDEAASALSQQIADLQKVVDRWDDAVNQRDQYALELVLAPQYMEVSDTGEVLTRDQVVSQMVTKGATRYTLTQKVTHVREVGDVAILIGTYNRAYEGSRLSRVKPRDEAGIFTQVYIRARSSWECIQSQRTRTVELTTKEKKKSKADSDQKKLHHELGFHLPGLHHSSDSSTPSSPK